VATLASATIAVTATTTTAAAATTAAATTTAAAATTAVAAPTPTAAGSAAATTTTPTVSATAAATTPAAPGATAATTTAITAARLDPTSLAVIINTADPLSIKIGNYYAKRRHIPAANIIRVRFPFDRDELPPQEFAPLRAAVERRASSRVQAYALTWARPYRVACMSITSAFTFGFDTKYCSTGCQVTALNPYFNTAVTQPYTELKIRLTMSIAATDFDQARALIDRGIHSDGTHPHGTAYLVANNDTARSTRALQYPLAEKTVRDQVNVETPQQPLEHRSDVMFYFDGAPSVPDIDTNHFLPGAAADHLTSFGGMLTNSPQMSSLRWLEAGATGSYGTVVEPCSFPQKFPNVVILMSYYLAGDTLIEAYWKSVMMPGQGLFIGEPLAAPFSHKKAQ
jgi:uncharacterized protein (TIGR03790 family)